MKHTNSFLYLAFILFTAIGLVACSQQEKTDIPSGKKEVVKNVAETVSKEVEKIPVTLYKNPNCQCCARWAASMDKEGFDVEVKVSDKLASIKDEQGVPSNLRSCHTAFVDGYAIEGHVPAEAIRKLLKERPDEKGLAVAGMPTGAPGTMGKKDTPYDVFVFGKGGSQSVYGTY